MMWRTRRESRERARAKGQPKQDPPHPLGAPARSSAAQSEARGRAGAVGEAAGALVLAEMDAGGPGVAALGQQLIDAAKQGTIERVGALLDQGVAVDSRDYIQATPLMYASRRGHRAVAALLLDREANVNAESAGGDTPALYASVYGHLDTLQLLVSRGADIHHRTHNGDSSLLCAALCDHLPVCEYLLSLGADLMAAANDDNETALAHYGDSVYPRLSPETKALRVAALEAWWAAGPHPSQVQRRRDERWARRGPLITVLAEHAYRPLQLRAQAIAAAAVGAPLPLIVHSAKEVVFRHEGLARYVILYL